MMQIAFLQLIGDRPQLVRDMVAGWRFDPANWGLSPISEAGRQ